MNYTFTVLTTVPKEKFVNVAYHSEGMPDYYKNFRLENMTTAELNAAVEEYAPTVRKFWVEYSENPESVEVTEGQSGAGTATLHVYQPAPEFNPETHKLVPSESLDGTTQTITHGWDIVALTSEELASRLQLWRDNTQVSMRQARLALNAEGKLGLVAPAISAIPDPQMKAVAELEWEYASVVDRTSPTIAMLQPALSMTDEQMDDLFRLADTL